MDQLLVLILYLRFSEIIVFNMRVMPRQLFESSCSEYRAKNSNEFGDHNRMALKLVLVAPRQELLVNNQD